MYISHLTLLTFKNLIKKMYVLLIVFGIQGFAPEAKNTHGKESADTHCLTLPAGRM
jgi:hypothetical protein